MNIPTRVRTLILLAAALVVLALAFLLLPFRLAYSNTHLAANVGSGHTSGQPEPFYPVAVWIEEKDSLSTLLRDRLVEKLAATGRFNPVVLDSDRPGPGDAPLLRVWISKPGLSWTPFYAQTRGEVRFGFSTYSPDVSLVTGEPFLFTSKNGAEYLYASRGEIELNDQTYGLVSLPGYWQWIADKTAQEIVARMMPQQ